MGAAQTAITSAERERLRTLAATNLGVQRKDRYGGDGFDATLDRFASADVQRIVSLYDSVKRSWELWLYMRDAPNYPLLRDQLVARFGSEQFFDAARAIGSTTREAGAMTPALARIVHDIRGGALTALTGYANLVEATASIDDCTSFIDSALLMARDHAKLMRNALIDLDPVVREADEGFRVHGIEDFVSKWSGATVKAEDRAVRVDVDCTFSGSITNRCLETSAIDRILYNYINNATRFTDDGRVELSILPVSDKIVRWVVTNSLTPGQVSWLETATEGDLQRLFHGGLTRGGNGIGLSGCTDFVAASFGVDPGAALEQGYLGARVIDSRYYAWFHWPAWIEDRQTPLPDCACSN